MGVSGRSSAAKYVSGRRRVRCSRDTESVDSLCEGRSFWASRRGDVTPALKRWDRDRPSDLTKESAFPATARLGSCEIGVERVVEENVFSCSSGGATLRTAEGLDTTGGVKVGVAITFRFRICYIGYDQIRRNTLAQVTSEL